MSHTWPYGQSPQPSHFLLSPAQQKDEQREDRSFRSSEPRFLQKLSLPMSDLLVLRDTAVI